MKRFSEQLNKASKTVKLQTVEKNELRERLVSYMEYHPLPAEMKVASKKKRVMPVSLKSEEFSTFSIPFTTIFKSSTFAALVLLVVVPMMAEKAVPGDTLYAIKVQTEEIRSTLTFDGYQKVEWETERLNRRIAEARLLASEGRLTEEVEAEVAKAVREHTSNAKREIAEMQSEDADEAALASIALDTTLEVQSTTYKEEELAAGEEAEGTMMTVNLIANAIDESRDPTSPSSATSSLPAYEKLMARIEINTTRIYELLANLQETAPQADLSDVVRRIQDLERSIQAATTEDDEVEARRQLVDALQRTQKIIVYLTELEVIETVDIETLVPVVLTNVEEAAESKALYDAIAEKTARIKTALEQIEDEDLREKVTFAHTTTEENVANFASSTVNFKEFKAQAEEALEMINDTLLLIEQHAVPALPVEEEQASSAEDMVEEEQATSTDPIVEGSEETTEEESVAETDEFVGEEVVQTGSVDSI